MNNRYEFMFFVEAKNCNPNGDPDMGNTPRIDPETMHGLITDVAIKRRIRNYIEVSFNHKDGMDIIKREASNMNTVIAIIGILGTLSSVFFAYIAFRKSENQDAKNDGKNQGSIFLRRLWKEHGCPNILILSFKSVKL